MKKQPANPRMMQPTIRNYLDVKRTTTTQPIIDLSGDSDLDGGNDGVVSTPTPLGVSTINAVTEMSSVSSQ